MLRLISDLRKEFMDVKNMNNGLEKFFQLEFDDLNIDPEYHELLEYRVADLLDETNKEVAWGLEYHRTMTSFRHTDHFD